MIDILANLIDWGQRRAAVRAMLLTSTRAVPHAAVDVFSDYDVILILDNIRPFVEDRSWADDFGEVLVAFWDPIHPDPDFGVDQGGNVIQYADGLKIDFTLWPVEIVQRIVHAPTLPAELDAGYRVLLDKDGITAVMSPPTYTAYIPTPPSQETYQLVINDFLTDAPYVAKCLWRGELLPAKWCLDYDMKHVYLRQMLEWRAGIEHNWSRPVGSLGKGLKKQLPPYLWAQLEATYADASPAANWDALFRTLVLYRQVAVDVGAHLGYTYPEALHQRVVAYVQHIQDMS